MYKYEETDRPWIRKAKRGNAEAFAWLYGKIYRDLYHFALYMMKQEQEAEDMVSEAVTAAFANIESLKKEEAFGSWMFRILGNCCKKKLLKDQEERAYLTATSPSEKTAEVPAAETMKDHAADLDVRAAFMALTEEERLIVGFSVFAGYKSPEIGEMLGIKAVTVRSKRSRAFQKMKERLGEESFYGA